MGSDDLTHTQLKAAIPFSLQKTFLYPSQIFPEKVSGRTKVWDAERKASGNCSRRGTSAGTSSVRHIQELQGQAMILPSHPSFLRAGEKLSFRKPQVFGQSFQHWQHQAPTRAAEGVWAVLLLSGTEPGSGRLPGSSLTPWSVAGLLCAQQEMASSSGTQSLQAKLQMLLLKCWLQTKERKEKKRRIIQPQILSPFEAWLKSK